MHVLPRFDELDGRAQQAKKSVCIQEPVQVKCRDIYTNTIMARYCPKGIASSSHVRVNQDKAMCMRLRLTLLPALCEHDGSMQIQI